MKNLFIDIHTFTEILKLNEYDVKKNLQVKIKEGKKSVLEGVPKSLPALVKAYRIQEKVRGVGFDWDNKKQVWDIRRNRGA